jgi:ribosome recycling factor
MSHKLQKYLLGAACTRLPFGCGLISLSGVTLNSLIQPLYHRKQCNSFYICISYFHSSKTRHAKAKKDKKHVNNNDGSSSGTSQLPDIKTYDASMEKRIFKLEDEFSKLQGGRIGVDMLNHITVDIVGGGKLQLTEISQISQKNQNQLIISVFDVANVPHIVKAIRESSSMSLNPSADGSIVLVNVPKPSKESREILVKEASKFAEKVHIINIYSTLFIYLFIYVHVYIDEN